MSNPPHILVLGEQFVDKYFVGTADRLSPEAPLPVVAVKEVIQRKGGAGNVTANLEALGAEVREILPPSHFPIKNRLIANGHQIARWDEHDSVDSYTAAQLRRHTADFEWADAVILSDYCKGAFGPGIIDIIAGHAPNGNFYIDTKRSPAIFESISTKVFFPNYKEYMQYISSYNEQKLVIRKESADGATFFNGGEPRYHCKSYSTNPISVSGGGDTVIASFVYNQCLLHSIETSLQFSMKAAAVAIGKPLTSVATLDEITKIT